MILSSRNIEAIHTFGKISGELVGCTENSLPHLENFYQSSEDCSSVLYWWMFQLLKDWGNDELPIKQLFVTMIMKLIYY